jgi:hypothetical protein
MPDAPAGRAVDAALAGFVAAARPSGAMAADAPPAAVVAWRIVRR